MVERPSQPVAEIFQGWMEYYQKGEGLSPLHALGEATKSAALDAGYTDDQFNYAVDQGIS